MNKIRIIVWAIALIVFMAVAAFSYYVGRQINYNLMYEDMVQETVRDMVKQEALKQ